MLNFLRWLCVLIVLMVAWQQVSYDLSNFPKIYWWFISSNTPDSDWSWEASSLKLAGQGVTRTEKHWIRDASFQGFLSVHISIFMLWAVVLTGHHVFVPFCPLKALLCKTWPWHATAGKGQPLPFIIFIFLLFRIPCLDSLLCNSCIFP